MSLRAIYFVGFRAKDWMCRVELDQDGGTPTLYARWRYYDPTPRGDHAWDNADEKVGSGLQFKPGTALGIALAAAEALQLTVAETAAPSDPPNTVDSIVQEDGSYDGLEAQARAKDWVHIKTFDNAADAERFLKGKEPS